MTRIMPLGSKILCLPITEEKNHTTGGGIELVEIELAKATVVEVGTGVTDVFKKGDIVIYPKSRGTSKPYKGQTHIFLDGNPVTSGGDVWALEIEEKPVIDKGDSL